MQLFKSTTLQKLLALILVFGLVICCFSACSDSSGSSNDDEDKDDVSNSKDDNDDLRDGLVKHECNGLFVYLSKDIKKGEAGADEYTIFSNEDLTVLVSGGEVDFSSSAEFAAEYAKDFEGTYTSVKVEKANGVSYAVCEIGDGTFAVSGFYVKDSYGWIINVTTYDYEAHSKDMIKFATLGQIDPDFEPEEDDPSNDATPETTAPLEPASEITAYAYVPSSWEGPGFWAWSSVTGENVFSAWPGEPMTYDGSWYTIEIPAWADYVIVNANNGSVQTEDIAVEAGKDIWIIIDTSATYYTLYYSEPTAEDLANHGY